MNTPNEEAREKLSGIIRAHLNQLAEHFENVQIMASNLEEGGEFTSTYNLGVGNWHARQHQAREWLIYCDEKVKIKARRDDEEEDDSDD